MSDTPKHTKETPGNFHNMMEYLHAITGEPIYKILTFERMDQLRRPVKKYGGKTKTVLKFPARTITIVSGDETYPYMVKPHGGESTYKVRFDLHYPDKPIDVILVQVYRAIDEFGDVVQDAGSYRNSLGGGWHETVQLYRIENQYFALI